MPSENETVRCRWFMACDNPAVAEVDHPFRGPVPVCARCHKVADGSAFAPRPTEPRPPCTTCRQSTRCPECGMCLSCGAGVHDPGCASAVTP